MPPTQVFEHQAAADVLEWFPGHLSAVFEPGPIGELTAGFRETHHVVWDPRTRLIGIARGGSVGPATGEGYPLLGSLPPLYPEWLGDRAFGLVHGCRFPYVVGEMANGIATPAMVTAAANAGCIGFYGAAGLSPDRVREGLAQIQASLEGSGLPWGANLIHSPSEPALEERVVDLFLEMGVRRISASAFMALTPGVVRYAATGLRRGGDGAAIRQNHVFAKVSRVEVARPFLSPPPEKMLRELVAAGQLDAAEAELASTLPVAADVTVEADSGGHTDNRPLTALLPSILALRDELAMQHRYAHPPRVGAGGGIGTPGAVAAAFALGAAYVMTGSINQCSVESGLSQPARQLLGRATSTDVIMAPSADMFELGVRVQVLRSGTLFGVRAQRLYDLYRKYADLEAIPADEREKIEREIFQAPLAEIWEATEAFWQRREPSVAERAKHDSRHRMALVFRWYLGKASAWAIQGTAGREADYQIWCGPAMGAFNQWAKGTALEAAEQRGVGAIALHLLEGAAIVTRAHQLRSFGAPVPASAFNPAPRLAIS